MAWEGLLVDIVKAGVTGLIGFIFGHLNAKRKAKRERLQDKVDDLKSRIREVADEATKYYTASMDERARNQASAIIVNNIKRISSDLVKLVQCCSESDGYFFEEIKQFRNAITSQPFGDSTIHTMAHDHPRIKQIQEAEDFIISRLSTFEDK